MLESPIHHNIANLGTDLFSATKKIFDDVIDDDEEEALIAMAKEAERLAALAQKGSQTSPTAGIFANPNEDLILDLDEEDQLVVLEDDEEEEDNDKDKNMDEEKEEEEQETVSQRQDDGGAMAVDEDPQMEN